MFPTTGSPFPLRTPYRPPRVLCSVSIIEVLLRIRHPIILEIASTVNNSIMTRIVSIAKNTTNICISAEPFNTTTYEPRCNIIFLILNIRMNTKSWKFKETFLLVPLQSKGTYCYFRDWQTSKNTNTETTANVENVCNRVSVETIGIRTYFEIFGFIFKIVESIEKVSYFTFLHIIYKKVFLHLSIFTHFVMIYW